MIELVLVLMVGAILTSIAMTDFSGVYRRMAVKGARHTFMSMHARARAQAIELGGIVRLSIDPVGDSAWLSSATDVLEKIDFDEEFHVDVATSSGSTVQVCMNPRGFADTGCNNFVSSVVVTFRQATDSARARILTLGQVVAY